jgi:hypothetical protein
VAIRHIVLVKWKATATAHDRAEAISRVRALPEQIPQIRGYVVEENLGPDASNFDLAIIGEFDDMASYEIYRDHPVHQALIRESTVPTLESRAAIQFSY